MVCCSKTMDSRCLVLFGAILLVMLNLVSGKSKNYKAYEAHMKRVRQFPCGAPQKRVIELQEVFKGKLYSNEKLYPSVTVLHRCDSSSGCCSQPTFSCAAATSEIVDLVFHVVQVNLEETEANTNLRIIPAFNHTSCACQPNDLPK